MLAALVVAVLIAATVDARTGRIPNEIALIAAACAIVASISAPAQLLGGAFWAGCYLVAWLRGGLGGGDVKLAFSTGTLAATAGMLGVLVAMLLANVLAALCLAYRRPPSLPHAPFMALGSVLALAVAVPERGEGFLACPGFM